MQSEQSERPIHSINDSFSLMDCLTSSKFLFEILLFIRFDD